MLAFFFPIPAFPFFLLGGGRGSGEDIQMDRDPIMFKDVHTSLRVDVDSRSYQRLKPRRVNLLLDGCTLDHHDDSPHGRYEVSRLEDDETPSPSRDC